MTTQLPSRGEIWMVDLNPTRGHEQAGVRPALVVSVDTFNHGPAGLAVVLPVTSRLREYRYMFPWGRPRRASPWRASSKRKTCDP